MLSGQAWPGQHAGGGGATTWPSGERGEASGASPETLGTPGQKVWAFKGPRVQRHWLRLRRHLATPPTAYCPSQAWQALARKHILGNDDEFNHYARLIY